MKGYENLNDAEITEYDTLLDAAMYGEPLTNEEEARLEELFAKVRGGNGD